jgi:hypothetical protein
MTIADNWLSSLDVALIAMALIIIFGIGTCILIKKLPVKIK